MTVSVLCLFVCRRVCQADPRKTGVRFEVRSFSSFGAIVNAPTRAGLTVWRALRTPQRWGPTGKLDAEETESDGRGVPTPAN